MADKSAIEWTDATWNPVRGCSIVSKGCTNCYAMRQAHRSSGAGGAYEGLTKLSKGGPVWTGEIRTVPDLLGQPGRWRRPRRIFVNSMSDLFHESVPDEFIGMVWQRMAWNQQHVFQVLTKRPRRMLSWLLEHADDALFAGERPEYEAAIKAHGWPVRNIWLGVSVEDQAAADERIPLLLQTPAAVRWISAEPLLGQVDVRRWLGADAQPGSCLHCGDLIPCDAHRGLDWIVAGGESGPGARPMHPAWARSLRDQCAAARVPFFFKQWGVWLPEGQKNADGVLCEAAYLVGVDEEAASYAHGWPDFTYTWRVSKKEAGRFLDGRTHDEYPA